MPKPYTSPTQASSSLLIHLGSLRVNQNDGGVIPAEFANTTDSANIGNTSSFAIGSGAPAFTHFDASVVQAANYNELIIDVNPIVTYSAPLQGAAVSNSGLGLDLQQAASTGRPFWLLVHLDGYTVTQLYATAIAATNTAVSVVNLLWATLLNFQLTSNFRGFAFLRPDLNVVYTDGTSLTRTMQNQLVQSCWNLNCAACFVTTRPSDVLSLVAPPLTGNFNSLVSMANPILGCNDAFQDKLVIAYPIIQNGSTNPSVILGQVSATLTSTNRDPGFTPNLEVAYVMPMDDTFWTSDGTGGVVSASGLESNLQNVFKFVAALGITQLGVYGITDPLLGTTGSNIPAPQVFLPLDASVNTTGAFNCWSMDGSMYVAYATSALAVAAGSPTTTVRQFNSSFVETVPYLGPAYP